MALPLEPAGIPWYHPIVIDSYSFGRMTVDGRSYSRDLMILPDGRIVHPWWRLSGHRLTTDDLTEVLDASPRTIVVGSGSAGLMTPDPALDAELERRQIRMIVFPTGQAVDRYNDLCRQGENVAGCFHLTC